MAKRHAPIRVLIVSSSYPQIGSPEAGFIHDEVKVFAEAGFAVTIMPIRPVTQVDPGLPANISIDPSYSRAFRFPAILRSALRVPFTADVWRELSIKPAQFLRRRFWKEAVRLVTGRRIFRSFRDEYDLAYSFWYAADTVALADALACPVITRAHGYDIYEDIPVNGGRIPFRDFSIGKLAKIVTLSNQAMRYLVDRYPLSADRLVKISLGVPGQPSGVGVLLEDRSALTFLSCAYPSANKRLPFIGQVVAALARRCPEYKITWHHLGCGPDELRFTGPVPANMTVKAWGRVPRAEVLDFYRRNRISFFVNLSLSEGQPVSVMEAMSFGVPVVVTTVGGSGEMLEAGGGLPVDVADSSEEIAERLAAICRDPGRLQQLGAEAYAVQQREFNAPVNARAMVSLVTELAGRD